MHNSLPLQPEAPHGVWHGSQHLSMQLQYLARRFDMRGGHTARLPMIRVPRGLRPRGRVPVLSREPLAQLQTLSAG